MIKDDSKGREIYTNDSESENESTEEHNSSGEISDDNDDFIPINDTPTLKDFDKKYKRK